MTLVSCNCPPCKSRPRKVSTSPEALALGSRALPAVLGMWDVRELILFLASLSCCYLVEQPSMQR